MLRLVFILFLIKHSLCLNLKLCNDSPYDQLCKVKENYDKREVPGSSPLIMIPSIDILEFSEINLLEGTITMIFSLSIMWEDRTIAYKPNKR